jgi:hypothetical protein
VGSRQSKEAFDDRSPLGPAHSSRPGADVSGHGLEAPAGALPVIPGLLRDTIAIRRQLANADGLVGYGLDADLWARTFWTFSIWRDRVSLDAFAASDPHHRIITRLRPKMSETNFAFFELAGRELPMTWEQMKTPVRPPSESNG